MAKTIKIRGKVRKGVTTIKCLISHPMETGTRKNKKTGGTIFKMIIPKTPPISTKDESDIISQIEKSIGSLAEQADQIAEIQPDTQCWFSFCGEPLLEPELLFKMLAYAKSVGLKSFPVFSEK